MHRRDLLKGTLMGAFALALRPGFAWAASVDDATAQFTELERKHGGRLGVSILDTQSGRRIQHRAGERFLMCSTFKWLAAAAVLARVDSGRERLDRRVVYGKDVLLDYAPVTSKHVGAPGLSVAELCAAAVTLSDNTAANLLLASMGGPTAITAFARSLGDETTRLDRIEPELNLGSPGDIRDTTTPDAMLADLHRVLLGNRLSAGSRDLLLQWLRGCITGLDAIRAGLPANWTASDKTGSGSQGETNDVAIIWPPRRKPLLVSAYYAGSHAEPAERKAVLAAVGRIAASM
ncbi:class A beta-lactamase [Rhodanobacter sp. Root480]|uniref:class A beta-lactamase n=1 Tax=Rhodanobacter sp. Root480 TaxID=1736542 RepID=UPI0007010ED9|nr:class A beta-lactamase [Rhodanobacter sp. Root480]KQX99419.1 class A beta-lactamase [Rhodanobacter sp. Root480]